MDKKVPARGDGLPGAGAIAVAIAFGGAAVLLWLVIEAGIALGKGY
jgi:hypothetical protein